MAPSFDGSSGVELATADRGRSQIRREEERSGGKEVSERPIPVFGNQGDVVSCRYIRNQINAGAVKRGVPLTPIEQAPSTTWTSRRGARICGSTWTWRRATS